MKKLKLLVLLLLPLCSISQNLQFHYDFGKANNGDQKIARNYFTATLEMLKFDKWGSTFIFADFDFDKGNGGASLSYFEIARKFTIHKTTGLSLQIEYNDGTPSYIIPSWLAGISYPLKIGEITIYSSLLYKYFNGTTGPDAQLTLVWNQHLIKDKLVFTGFFDIWSQDKFGSVTKQIVFLTEPQFWFILNDHFSLGSEIEISRNFFTFDNEFEIMPTIAVKWNL